MEGSWIERNISSRFEKFEMRWEVAKGLKKLLPWAGQREVVKGRETVIATLRQAGFDGSVDVQTRALCKQLANELELVNIEEAGTGWRPFSKERKAMKVGDDIELSQQDGISQPEAVEAGVVEYRLPEDLMILREVGWLPCGVTFTLVPNVDWERIPLHQVDGETPVRDSRGVPTYHRRADFIVLNDPPRAEEAGEGRLLFDYIRHALPLAHDEQVLETQFAKLMQEVVVFDVAVEVVQERMHRDAQELLLQAEAWAGRLRTVAAASTMPKVVHLQPKTPALTLRRSGLDGRVRR